jgi:hypothetical protein
VGFAFRTLAWSEWHAKRRLSSVLWLTLAGLLFLWAGFRLPYGVLAVLAAFWLLLALLAAVYTLGTTSRVRQASARVSRAVRTKCKRGRIVLDPPSNTDDPSVHNARLVKPDHAADKRGIVLTPKVEGLPHAILHLDCVVQDPDGHRSYALPEVSAGQTARLRYPRNIPQAKAICEGPYEISWQDRAYMFGLATATDRFTANIKRHVHSLRWGGESRPYGAFRFR